jgi:hypothetical protein
MSDPQNLEEELARLRAENTALKTQKQTSGSLTFKVSAKGAVSVYGLGRFPVTLYQEQWDKLIAASDALKRFIDENRTSLKKKD